MTLVGEQNRAEHARLVAELRERLAHAALGGNEQSRQRHVDRGKLLPRDRVDALLDPGSPFLELSPWRPTVCTTTTPRGQHDRGHRPRRGS